jgi:archaetidylinositol phosphate synthase
MLEKNLRHHYQKWFVDPVANAIQHHTNALSITILSGLLGLAVIPALYYSIIALAVLLLVASGYLDTLDGTIARQTKTSSDFGSAMDIVTDRIVEISAVIGLCLVDPIHRAFLSLLMLASMLLCITSFLVVGIFTTNDSHKGFHYSPGIMERAEAFIFFILMMLLPHYFVPLSIIFIILVMLTTAIHLIEFRSASLSEQ